MHQLLLLLLLELNHCLHVGNGMDAVKGLWRNKQVGIRILGIWQHRMHLHCWTGYCEGWGRPMQQAGEDLPLFYSACTASSAAMVAAQPGRLGAWLAV